MPNTSNELPGVVILEVLQGGGVSATVGRSSEQSSEGDSGATAGGADEEMPCGEVLDVDDEEQYMSADEGVNSAASDDVVGSL